MEAKTVIFAVLFFSILIEGTVEYIKLSLQKQMCKEIVGAFIFSLLISIGYKLDFVEAYIGLKPIVPYLGNVLTALVVSRGSNYVFDLVGKFTEAKKEMDTILEGDEARPADEVNVDTVNHEAEEGVG